MKKSLLLLAISLLSLSHIHAQEFDWAVNLGGVDKEYGRSVAVDSSGNVYICGFYSGTADFDPGSGTINLTSAGATDAFIVKMDPSGNTIWAKSVGSTGSEYAYSISTDNFGNVFVGGRFSGTSDMDPGSANYNVTSEGGADMFILKLDSLGDFLWAAAMGSSATDQVNALATDAAGNVYASGVFNDSADFDPGSGTFLLPSEGQDVFILKLNANGSLNWAKKVGGIGDERAYSLDLDGSGNVYVTGVFSSTADFDPGTGVSNLSSAALLDGYVLKLNSTGDFQWVHQMSGGSYVFGYGITADDFGNIYSTGYFRNTADFNVGSGIDTLRSNGNYDIFLQKLDAAGNFKWAKGMGGLADDRGYSVATDMRGDVYLTGYFLGDVNFNHSGGNNTFIPYGLADLYIHKTDSSGNYLDAKQIGGAAHDFGLSLTVDGSGNIYTTGNFEGTADFDPDMGNFNLTPHALSDVFILKLKQCDLLDTTVTVNGGTITANKTNAAYRWINCDNNTVMTGETARSFSPTTGGYFALEITDGSCVDTTQCYFISGIGLEPGISLGLNIYPNPVKDIVYMEFYYVRSEMEIELISLSGEVLIRQFYKGEKSVSIDVGPLAKGIYFIRIKSGTDEEVRKIVKS